jgi:predicted CXXCH cytochrome family protein
MFRKLAGLTAVAGLFISGSAFAAMAGSAHDFSNVEFTTGVTSGEICVACHAPHENQNTTGLLWNHTAQTTAISEYTTYTSPSLDGAAGNPGPVSYLCLSCHDGTVAVDSYGGNTGSWDVDDSRFANGGAVKFGTSLSNDHPIGITYSQGTGSGQDPELRPTNFATYTLGNGTPTSIDDDFLFEGVVECGSCHDVHATVSGTNPNLLLVDNAGSAFCLVCHNK